MPTDIPLPESSSASSEMTFTTTFTCAGGCLSSSSVENALLRNLPYTNLARTALADPARVGAAPARAAGQAPIRLRADPVPSQSVNKSLAKKSIYQIYNLTPFPLSRHILFANKYSCCIIRLECFQLFSAVSIQLCWKAPRDTGPFCKKQSCIISQFFPTKDDNLCVLKSIV